MTVEDYTIEAEITVQLENNEVYFIGEACTNDYVSTKQLEDINKYFVNQPVIYRHDHPSKEKGGSIYGRVVESEIIQKESGTQSLKFKSLMKQTLPKHKKLIKLAEEQAALGVPIRYSVGFVSTKTDTIDEADVFEVSVTNDPVCEECENINIMEKKDMPENEKIQETNELAKKEVVISELQKKFEEEIGFKKELEKENVELKEKNVQLEKLIGESKTVLADYSDRLSELEKKADAAERYPIVEKIFALEGNSKLKARYENPSLWSIPELTEQYEEVKKLNANKFKANQAVTRTMEQSRHKLMDGEDENVAAFEAKIKAKMSPELKKSLGMN